jgi:D-alanyl-D-alanine dipeptidase
MNSNLPEIFDKFQDSYLNSTFEHAFTLKDLLNTLRPFVNISECDEGLVSVEKQFDIFSPHPYLKEGAKYETYGPWFLREGVVKKLVVAEDNLKKVNPYYRLKIFDCYRPQTVQTYMRDVEFRRLAVRENIDPLNANEVEKEKLLSLVDSIWARPSVHPNPPPPHSTGSAVDLTICDEDGKEVNMGSEIDEVSERSLPNYYKDKNDKLSKCYHSNRELLRQCMEDVGFYRLSHEWWHFSYGDQVWAVFESFRKKELADAIYGEV